MKTTLLWTRGPALGLLLMAGSALAAQTAPQITFEEQAVTASGLTPGGSAVFFGVEHRVEADYSRELVRRYEVSTVAADGTARFEPPRPVAPASVWVAVDQKTGRYAVAAPEGYRIAQPAAPPRLGAGPGSLSDEILDERPYLMGLVVRPDVGAWIFAGGDGGQRDEDGLNDGHLRFALDKLDPLPGSPAAPPKIEDSDLWFVVDPRRMEISVLKGGVAQ